jgi:hypothetical protein
MPGRFVAMTTLSQLVKSFSALPTISSLPPFEYMLAVSKKARHFVDILIQGSRPQGTVPLRGIA